MFTAITVSLIVGYVASIFTWPKVKAVWDSIIEKITDFLGKMR